MPKGIITIDQLTLERKQLALLIAKIEPANEAYEDALADRPADESLKELVDQTRELSEAWGQKIAASKQQQESSENRIRTIHDLLKSEESNSLDYTKQLDEKRRELTKISNQYEKRRTVVEEINRKLVTSQSVVEARQEELDAINKGLLNLQSADAP